MKKLVFSERACKGELNVTDSRYDFKVNKPMICPRCGVYEDGIRVMGSIFDSGNEVRFCVVMYRCPNCTEKYLVLYHVDLAAKRGEFKCFYPELKRPYENEVLGDIFPRFIEAYNQAHRAEEVGDIELAAIGYRTALEILVKDYAITEMGKTLEEVAKKKLVDAIREYLGERDLITTADVVRILGNDYTHYERRYPELDFALLKQYLEIFVKMVETRILIAHPPVTR